MTVKQRGCLSRRNRSCSRSEFDPFINQLTRQPFQTLGSDVFSLMVQKSGAVVGDEAMSGRLPGCTCTELPGGGGGVSLSEVSMSRLGYTTIMTLGV